jgi:NAD(P)-dependent dehydrogenase (short-subunit alcohol dehydrogenase family)
MNPPQRYKKLSGTIPNKIIVPLFFQTHTIMNILVTGASKGIGSEIVKIFSRSKKNQVIAIGRDEKALDELIKECHIRNPESNIRSYPFDITSFDFYDLVIQRLTEYMPHIDILINNAGYLKWKKFLSMDPAVFDDIFNVNVKGLYFFTQALLPFMNKGAHIVNIGSMGGIQGSKKFPGLSAYSASKGAVAILTEALAEELQEEEIRVNCLALGGVDTEMFRKAFPQAKAPYSANHMGQYIVDFALNGWKYYNGKVLPVSLGTP